MIIDALTGLAGSWFCWFLLGLAVLTIWGVSRAER